MFVYVLNFNQSTMKKYFFPLFLAFNFLFQVSFAQKAKVVKDAQGRVHERYNSKGILTEENDYEGDILTGSTKYDDNGNLTEEISFTPDGKIKEKGVSKYDTNNNRTELVLS